MRASHALKVPEPIGPTTSAVTLPLPVRPSEDVLADTIAISQGPLAEAAIRIDRGHYPIEILGRFGAAGALSAHLDRQGRRFGLAIVAMEAAGRSCGATSFLMWCHDVCGLYMEQSGNPALTGARLDRHAAGQTFGGTAMSNPMKTFAGIESMLLRAKAVPGGFLVNGQLPWVSHIRAGQYCGAVAAVEGGAAGREIMFLLHADEPAELRPCPEFSGMEGTSTWGIRLKDYFVGQDDLIADPVRPFVARIRAAFIQLQCGMGLGVVRGSLDCMLAVEETLGHVNHFLHDRPDEIEREYADLRARIMTLAETPYETAPDYLIDVLDARAQIAELSLRASQSALLHQGARGYQMAAAPQRRIREAHFVAIVTPAIKHLRWEMARLSREVMPTGAAA